MNIAEAQIEMSAVVEAAKSKLKASGASASRDAVVAKSKHAINKIVKAYKRKIDIRAERRAGKPRFSINERKGLEDLLMSKHNEFVTMLDGLLAD